MSLVGDLNARIAQFVTAEENRCLRPGTGGYSTPFRGGLFSKLRASEVDAAWLPMPSRSPTTGGASWSSS
jgi:hypothetical protein